MVMRLAMFISGKSEKFPLAILAKLKKEKMIDPSGFLLVYKRQISFAQVKKYYKRKGLFNLFLHAFRKPFQKYHEQLVDPYFEEYAKTENITLDPLKSYHLPVRSFSHLNSSAKVLRKFKPDLIIHSGGGLINKDIIGIPPYGILNCHPSPLPEFRGEKSIKEAMAKGRMGVTVHYIDEGIDTGKIISKKEFPPLATTEENKDKAMCLGVNMIVDAVKDIERRISRG